MSIQSADTFMGIFGYTRIKQLIFGSTAIKFWFPQYTKIPKDLDYIIECIPKNKEPNTEYYKNNATDYILSINTHDTYVDADLLYTIKVSHLAWEPKNGKWFKHVSDVIFLQKMGCKLNHEVYQMLYKEWEILHGSKSHISLNKATEMFFKDGVRRQYDHDWLHDYFKVSVVPAYTRALVSDNSPLMSETKFNTLPHYYQLLCGIEEMFVISYERGITLPDAYKALVTKLSKGFFNLFLIMNAEELLDGLKIEKEYYKLLRRKLDDELRNSN